MAVALFDDDFLRRLQRLGLLAKRIQAAAPTPGQRRGPRMGDGLEFADHRAYAPGDDLRFLDWHYYARMERLLLRLFHEHAEGAVTILLDASASMALGEVCKFDYARRMAAALAYVAMASLDRVSIRPFAGGLGEGLHTGRNRAQVLEVLDFLEHLTAGGPTDVRSAAEQFARGRGRAGTVVLVSDMIDAAADLPEALALLRRREGDLIALHVVDAADAAPAAGGAARLAAVESGRRLSVHAGEELLAAYRRAWADFARDVERACLSRAALYVPAPTSAPFDRLVLETLRRAGLLAT